MKRLKFLFAAGMVTVSIAGMAYAAIPAFATDELYPHPRHVEWLW